jgi:aminoglycoside/choline kinase family phosphotransferase
MIENKLTFLFENWAKEKVIEIIRLPASGSYRSYYRISGKTQTCLGVYNKDAKENLAFIKFSKHFYNKGLNVPQVFAENNDEYIYLIEDFGDETLFNRLQTIKKNNTNENEVTDIYKKVITELLKFQISASKDLDYNYCTPRKKFDKQSMLWDLNYFKYYFLKLAQIPFDEQILEEDFEKFTDFLLETDTENFMYRDFQSRNIMLVNNTPYFLDYQGGRKGALQYDIASLLYDAKADLKPHTREILLDFYLTELQKYMTINAEKFKSYFYGYVIIRILQAMGAYGFRGFYENKPHFLQSIPYAICNLNNILGHISFPIQTNTLFDTLSKLSESKKIRDIVNTQKLNIKITSFSFKKQHPIDENGNGGGFVFDCRALPNPGRQEKFKTLTGKDKTIIDFLESDNTVNLFIDYVLKIISISINNYIERGFENLMISFGCTGGQHRSVYCAEKIATMINQKYNIQCEIKHLVQDFNNNSL